MKGRNCHHYHPHLPPQCTPPKDTQTDSSKLVPSFTRDDGQDSSACSGSPFKTLETSLILLLWGVWELNGEVWALLRWFQVVSPDLTRSLLCSSQISSSPKFIPASFMLPSSLKFAFLSVLFVSLRTYFNFLVSTSGQLWLQNRRKEGLAALLTKARLFI